MKRRFAAVLAVLVPVSLGGFFLTATVEAQPAWAQTNNTTVTIFNFAANKCLDMTGGSTQNYAQPQIWTCNGNPQQNWQFIPSGVPGYFLIRNNNSSKCLSIDNNDPNAGAEVIQYNCNYSGNDTYENWHKVKCTGSYCKFQNEGNDNFMEPAGCGTTRGLKIYMNVCRNGADLWES